MRRAIAGVVVVVAAAAVLIALLAGDDDEPAAERSRGSDRFARTFPVDGRAMYLECRGRGSPVVVLEAGLGVVPGPTWADVVPRVAADTRVCLYERAGVGSSAPAPGPRTSSAMVDELRALLRTARVAGPYVLVGASFGGLNMQLMAASHPDETAGLVLVDSLHPDFDRRFGEVMGREAARARAEAIANNIEGVGFEDQLQSGLEVKAAGRLPPVPLRVLVHSDSFDPGGDPVPKLERLWRSLQRDLASQSPEGKMEVVPGTTHRIAEDAPDAVADTITEVVELARG